MTSSSLPSDPDKVSSPSDSPPKGSRRSFFGWVITAIAGFIGLSLGGPLAGYVIAPALKRRESCGPRSGRQGVCARANRKNWSMPAPSRMAGGRSRRKKGFGPSNNRQARWSCSPPSARI